MNALTIGNCRVINGDCFDVLKDLDVIFDAVISDPPFGVTSEHWDIAPPLDLMWQVLDSKTKPNANFVMFACGKFSIDLVQSNYRWYRYDLIWQKNNKVGFLNAGLQPMRAHESIFVFGRPGYQKEATYNPIKILGGAKAGRIRSNKTSTSGVYRNKGFTHIADGYLHPSSVLPFANDRGNNQQGLNLHTTQKPIALMMWLVATYTNKGDTVLDPYAGSGSTALACLTLGRRCVTIEKEKKFFDITCKRIERYAGAGVPN